MFMDTLASVQFQDVTRQQIEQVISGIERLDTHADALAGAIERGADVRREDAIEPLAKQMEQQFSNYVMDQQRDAHRQAIGPAAAEAAPARGSRPGAAATMRPPRRRSRNVELF
jgi:methyl-accepting chemotaxis protein